MDDNDNLLQTHTPTAARPLLGMTILVVEDSLYACDAVRLMCLHSGARIRRADCLRSARRHLQVYRPSAIIIDLGLPDGSGLDLIRELSETSPRISVILGISGDDNVEQAATDAGADGFLAKPIANLGQFQETILSILPPERQPNGPRKLRDEYIRPDRVAYRDDMRHVSNILDDDTDGPVLDYVAQFLAGVARSAEDDQLAHAAQALAKCRARGGVSHGPVARIAGLVQDRLADRAAM